MGEPQEVIKPPQTSSYILDTLWGDDNPLIGGYCVAFVQYKTKLPHKGNANTWARHINSTEPVIGSVIVTSHGYWGHVGIIKAYQNGKVLMESRNYRQRYLVSYDWLDEKDPKILGYIVF